MQSFEPAAGEPRPTREICRRGGAAGWPGRLIGPISFVLLAMTLGCSPSPEGDGRLNVLLISVDTLRADHLGCYGNPRVRTPRLDRLADEGVRFAAAMAPAPTTLASHTSMLTGRYPRAHGTARNGFTVHPNNETLAETLSQAGYDTGGVIGSFALDSRFGISQGFAFYDERFDQEVDNRRFDQNQRPADQVTDVALDWLGRDRGDAPFFLFVHYFDVHAAFAPPAPYDAMYTTDGTAKTSTLDELKQAVFAHQDFLLPEAPGYEGVIYQGLDLRLLTGANGLPLPEDRKLANLYAGEVSWVDAEVGRLLDDLKRRGLLEDTLVIFTADHGESFWEHGDFWNHGLWVYDTTVHVPLIVRLPDGAAAGRVVASPVSGVDVAPTILRQLGIQPPNGVEGVALQPAWTGGSFERGPVFSEATQPVGRVEQASTGWPNAAKAKAVRRGPWKLHWAPYLEYVALYNLEDDPGETQNLLLDPSPEHVRLRDELMQEMRAWFTAARPLPSAFDPAQVNEVRERLRSLGYAGR